MTEGTGKQLILTQVMTANLPPPPSEGEKYNQIRTKSWILGPVATKWSFRRGCFALVSKLLLLFVQRSVVAMQKATYKTLLTSGILQFGWDTKALTDEKRYKLEAENDSVSPSFIFSVYPPKTAWLKFHLAQK